VPLSQQDIENQCLHYMQPSGKSVRATRLPLGFEYAIQVNTLSLYYQIPTNAFDNIKFDHSTYDEIKDLSLDYFSFERLSIIVDDNNKGHLNHFSTYISAFHRLMFELLRPQTHAIRLALSGQHIQDLIIDGGFINNDIYTKMIALSFPDIDIYTADIANASAIGAAMVMMDAIPQTYLIENYHLHKISID
jgi:hypothetical protein